MAVLISLRTTALGACRDCAQSGFGGPADNRFTAYDPICRGELCRSAGYPQVSVNLSNLTLFVSVNDVVLGGSPGFSLERAYNQDDTRNGPFGIGWSFNLGDSLTPDTDGTLVLRGASGRVDRFAAAETGGGFVAVSSTNDALILNSDGTYTLQSPGSSTTRIFTASGKLQAIVDGGATRVSMDYDASGNLTTAHYRGRTLQFAYGGGLISSVTDSSGRSVVFTYSSDGHLSLQTNADGRTVQYQYDNSGNLTAIVYAGATIAVTYGGDPDAVAVATVTTPDGAVRQYDVPLAATQIRARDGNGDATLYTSSATGQLLSVTDANGNTVSYTYDSAGHRLTAVNGAGETTKFTYDGSGNLINATDAAGNRWAADYTGSPAGAGPAHVTDPNGNLWTLSYDAAGNLLSAGNPAAPGFTAKRSSDEQITSVTDGLGNQTSYQYNADGLLASMTDALSSVWNYQYDSAARISGRTDPAGDTVQAVYSAANVPGSFTAGNATLQVDYSGLQRDALNRLTTYTDSFGNQIGYQYDAAGQLTAMTLPGGKTVKYQYDHAHRLVMVSDWLGNFALYRYDAAGWPVSVSVSGGPVTIYQYDAGRRLRSIVSTGPDGTPVAAYRYTLDANGNRTAVSALEPAAAAPIAAYSFTFDAVNHPVSRSDGQQYQYDARHNLTSISGSAAATLAYDPFARLASFNSSSEAYDSAGFRVGRGDRRFLYDPSGAQPRLVMEADSSNTPVAWYIYGLGLLWNVTASGSVYFYHFDGSGNVVALSSPTAGVVNQYRYDPLGRLISAKESVDNPFRARGEAGVVDDGNGLLFDSGSFLFPDLRLSLPASPDLSPAPINLQPAFSGGGACFFQGVGNCAFATARRQP